MGHDHAHDDHAHEGHDHGGHSHDGAASHHHGTDLVGRGPEELAECPVMRGNTVVKADAEAKGLFRDHEGERYWFCCAACEAPFDADPAKYARVA